jgi:hypothetical protein
MSFPANQEIETVEMYSTVILHRKRLPCEMSQLGQKATGAVKATGP